jgi:hypothetical protein
VGWSLKVSWKGMLFGCKVSWEGMLFGVLEFEGFLEGVKCGLVGFLGGRGRSVF